MERMITAMDANLLEIFKTSAENGAGWDGDIAYAKVFELWLLSLKNLMHNENDNVMPDLNAESENNDDDADDNDDDSIGTARILEDIINAEDTATVAVDGIFPCDNQNITEYLIGGEPIIVFNQDVSNNFLDQQPNTLAPIECIEPLQPTAASESNHTVDKTQPNDIVVQLDASGSFKSALQVLQEAFPVKSRPVKKRTVAKKPSVLSDPKYIQKRKDILEAKKQAELAKQLRKEMRAQKLAKSKSQPKRKRSNSFMVSNTIISFLGVVFSSHTAKIASGWWYFLQATIVFAIVVSTSHSKFRLFRSGASKTKKPIRQTTTSFFGNGF